MRRKRINVTAQDVFDSKYQINDVGCWIWQAPPTKNGYGVIYHSDLNSQMYAHRASYILHKGPIPDGLCVCHKCDVRNCVNPEHLFLGTYLDNCRDKIKKGRDWKRDHRLAIAKLTEEQAREIILDNTTPTSKLCTMYNISRGALWKIKNRITWKYLHKLLEEGEICGVTV